MEFNIVESSPQAAEVSTETPTKGKKSMYPFDELNVGMSFTIEASKVKVASIKTLAYRRNKSGERKFVIVEHHDMKPALIEVARVK